MTDIIWNQFYVLILNYLSKNRCETLSVSFEAKSISVFIKYCVFHVQTVPLFTISWSKEVKYRLLYILHMLHSIDYFPFIDRHFIWNRVSTPKSKDIPSMLALGNTLQPSMDSGAATATTCRWRERFCQRQLSLPACRKHNLLETGSGRSKEYPGKKYLSKLTLSIFQVF